MTSNPVWSSPTANGTAVCPGRVAATADEQFDDEVAADGEMPRGVAETCDLFRLGAQIGNGLKARNTRRNSPGTRVVVISPRRREFPLAHLSLSRASIAGERSIPTVATPLRGSGMPSLPRADGELQSRAGSSSDRSSTAETIAGANIADSSSSYLAAVASSHRSLVDIDTG